MIKLKEEHLELVKSLISSKMREEEKLFMNESQGNIANTFIHFIRNPELINIMNESDIEYIEELVNYIYKEFITLYKQWTHSLIDILKEAHVKITNDNLILESKRLKDLINAPRGSNHVH